MLRRTNLLSLAIAALLLAGCGQARPPAAAMPAAAGGSLRAKLADEFARTRLEDGRTVAEALAEPEAAPLRPKPGANPVVLIPGYLDLEVYFFRIKRRLHAQGLETTYLDLFPNMSNIKEAAGKLAARVAEVRSRTGAAKVDIVGHSMGGLIARYYIQELGGLGTVDRLVTIATPHHGTIVANLGPGSGADQMLPGSAFLQALNAGDETPGDIRYVSIRGGLDEIVIPHDSPILDGAENHFIRFAAHGSILVQNSTMKLMERSLAR